MVGPWWIPIVKTRMFIQPAVTQRYAKPIYPIGNAELVDLTAAFDYKIQNGRFTNWLIAAFARPPRDLDWRDGIRNHTARRLIRLAAGITEKSSGAVTTAEPDGVPSPG